MKAYLHCTFTVTEYVLDPAMHITLTLLGSEEDGLEGAYVNLLPPLCTVVLSLFWLVEKVAVSVLALGLFPFTVHVMVLFDVQLV